MHHRQFSPSFRRKRNEGPRSPRRSGCFRGARSKRCLAMIYREVGQFKTSYAADQAIFPIRQDRWLMFAALAVAYLAIPAAGSEYWLVTIMIPFLVFALAALGLNLLTGYAGQVSLGTGGFMAVGAFATYKLDHRLPRAQHRPRPDARRPHHRAGRRAVRLPEPADQGFLPRGGDARRAVLPDLGVQQVPVVLQLQRLGRDQRAAARRLRPCLSSPGPRPIRGRNTCSC